MPDITRMAGHSFLSAPLDRTSLVLDLGVNRGEFARAVVDRFGCRVYGVEPVPELFAALPTIPGVTVEPLAVTADGAGTTLYLNPGREATIDAGLKETGAVAVSVEGTTLAGLLDRHGIERVALAKVDIEGAELPMIEGTSLADLRRVDQFTIEFHDWLDPAQTLPVTHAKHRLRQAGFAELALSRGNEDVLFVNTERIDFGVAQRAAALLGHKYPQGIGRIVARRASAVRR